MLSIDIGLDVVDKGIILIKKIGYNLFPIIPWADRYFTAHTSPGSFWIYASLSSSANFIV